MNKSKCTSFTNKVIKIVEKIVNFNKQQKGKGLKILTPKQILQRVPITLGQVEAGNASENLLNETRKINKSKCASFKNY